MLKASRSCMSDVIAQELSRRIVTGAVPPGTRLTELQLAKEFETSQTPVREALRELETQGFVESVPFKGTYVRSISDEEMSEAYTVRGALEQLAAELAAPRLVHNVGRLREAVGGIHAAARARDLEGYSTHNLDFHKQIVVASGNSLLLKGWLALSFEARVRVYLHRQEDLQLERRAAEHDPIVDALEVGDGAQAGRLLREHARACLRRWLAHGEGAAPPPEGASDARPVAAGLFS